MYQQPKVTADDSNTPSQPLVSVIVPTHNYGALISETLNSLQRQTLTDWECIVVDDGSTDETAEVVARFAQSERRIHYIWQQNQRQAVAKNTGLALAKGKYIQFLDADDLLEPGKLESHVDYLEAHSEVDIVYGGVRFFHNERPGERLYSMFGENERWMPEVSGTGKALLLVLVRRNIMVSNAPLLRRSVMNEVGEFDAVLPPIEDWDYWIRCAIHGKRFEFRDVVGTLALVRSHADSSSRQAPAMLRALRGLRLKIGSVVDDRDLLRLNREIWSQEEADLGAQNVATGHRLAAGLQFTRAAAICPRVNGRVKWFLCALACAFASERQLRGLMKASPSRLLTG